MTEDPFAMFYPGSKRSRRDALPKNPVRTMADWELKASKKTYTIGGRKVHLYRISALALALNKTERTIRQWMHDGYLPNTFRLSAADANDDLRRGAHRMFTHEMIQAAVAAFAKRGLLGVPRVEWSMHPELPAEILAEWQRITREAFTPATDPERS